MTGGDFYDKCLGVGLQVGIVDGTLRVFWPQAKATFSVTTQAVLDNEWGRLCELLTCVKPLHGISHMSRICGYYAPLESWNRSKKGELKDRQKGWKEGRYGV